MVQDLVRKGAHPTGEQPKIENRFPEGVTIDTYAGTVHVKFLESEAVTPFGQLSFFFDCLKTGEVFDRFVADCPVRYESNNAPTNRRVLGTLLVAMLGGATRYAHIARLHSDGVLPEHLGMTKPVGSDSVRRFLKVIAEEKDEGEDWMLKHLFASIDPLLTANGWILDVDTTIKPLYGHQEGAEIGYNPRKPAPPEPLLSHLFGWRYATDPVGGCNLG
jgi:hypothetical protein